MVNLNLSRYFRPCCLQRYTDMQCTYKGLSLKYTLSGRKTKRILSIWALHSNVTTFRHIMHGRFNTNATTCPLTASWPIKPLNFRPNHTSPLKAICNNQKIVVLCGQSLLLCCWFSILTKWDIISRKILCLSLLVQATPGSSLMVELKAPLFTD